MARSVSAISLSRVLFPPASVGDIPVLNDSLIRLDFPLIRLAKSPRVTPSTAAGPSCQSRKSLGVRPSNFPQSLNGTNKIAAVVR